MVPISEIKKALLYIATHWAMQSNAADCATQFIYTSNSIEDLEKLCAKNNIDFQYALHRWYNFNCAKVHEHYFISNGAIKEPNTQHKTIDFYLWNIPFDLKSTYFPKAIIDNQDYILTERKGKNNLILWLYNHQSKQGRYHLENRLFIVCEDLKGKSNFELIEEKIKCFIQHSKQKGFNKILLHNKLLYSDIIWIPK